VINWVYFGYLALSDRLCPEPLHKSSRNPNCRRAEIGLHYESDSVVLSEIVIPYHSSAYTGTPGRQPVSASTVYRVLTENGYGVFKKDY
jgi:hypothetical protein